MAISHDRFAPITKSITSDRRGRTFEINPVAEVASEVAYVSHRDDNQNETREDSTAGAVDGCGLFADGADHKAGDG